MDANLIFINKICTLLSARKCRCMLNQVSDKKSRSSKLTGLTIQFSWKI